jgi:dCMP deaminase
MRIDLLEWGMRLAEVTALRSTCLRRNVGCVVMDGAGKVLATGYNGVASGEEHCNDEYPSLSMMTLADTDEPIMITPHACAGASLPSGTGLDLCGAIHAEANALLQCADVTAIRTCFVTASPCIQCVKMLMNTGCQVIYFRQPYAHDAASRELWTRKPGRGWVRFK